MECKTLQLWSYKLDPTFSVRNPVKYDPLMLCWHMFVVKPYVTLLPSTPVIIIMLHQKRFAWEGAYLEQVIYLCSGKPTAIKKEKKILKYFFQHRCCKWAKQHVCNFTLFCHTATHFLWFQSFFVILISFPSAPGSSNPHSPQNFIV